MRPKDATKKGELVYDYMVVGIMDDTLESLRIRMVLFLMDFLRQLLIELFLHRKFPNKINLLSSDKSQVHELS